MRKLICVLSVLTGCTASITSRHDYSTMLGELRQSERARDTSASRVANLASAKALDRRVLIEAVLAANRDVESMRQAWRASLAEARGAGALDDPILSYEVAPLSITGSDAPFGQRVELRQKIPFPGKRGAAGDAAVAEAAVMRGEYDAMQLMVAELASELFDDLYLNVRAFELNEQHRKLVEQMQKVASARIASGRGSTQDALQAEVELGHLEHDRVMLETERISIVARIDGLLHRDPTAPLPMPTGDLAVPAMPPEAAVLIKTALGEHPRKEAADARVNAAEATARSAERAYYPDLELMGSYDSMWDMPEHRWMVGVGIEIPLQRGKRAADVEAAQARVAQARAAVDSASDTIRVDVVRAQRELVEGIHVVKLYDDRLLPAARAQVDAALAGFTSGANDFPAVITAERELREIQLAAIRARTDAWKRQAALDRAIGKLSGGAP
jgi:outer membrane protein, heavy metal efflux system